MKVSGLQANEIVAQFVRQSNLQIQTEGAHGVQLEFTGENGPFIAVLTKHPDATDYLTRTLPVSATIGNHVYRVQVRVEAIPSAGLGNVESEGKDNKTRRGPDGKVAGGSMCIGTVDGFYGTMGTAFRMREWGSEKYRTVLLSNWNVLCNELGNATPTGAKVHIKNSENDWEHMANLHSMEKLQSTDNLWDMAIAEFIDAQAPAAEMLECGLGGQHQYTTTFATQVSDSDTAIYETTGAKYPRCASGKLIAMGAKRTIDYGDGIHRVFIEQLVFEPISDNGDGGSVVVRRQDQAIVGLIFAGTENVVTIANPIYRYGLVIQPVGELLLAPENKGDPAPPWIKVGKRVTSSEWPNTMEYAIYGPPKVYHLSYKIFSVRYPWIEVKRHGAPAGIGTTGEVLFNVNLNATPVNVYS